MNATVRLPKGVRITEQKPALEPGVPWTGYVLPQHIKPNPNQPRKVFPEDAQAALRKSHKVVGQRRAVSVIPFEDPENPEIWFMIDDGERSWRSLTSLEGSPVLVIYNPLSSTEDLNFHSFVANFGGKGHTHGEIIDAVWDEIKGKKRSVKDFADAVTRTEVWVGNYLHLHNLHPKLRELLDFPTPKKDRIPFQLAVTISQAEQSEQLAIFEGTKGMSSKSAVRSARKRVDASGTRVSGRSRKPSDDIKILKRIFRTLEEDLSYVLHIPDDVLESPSFDKELVIAHLVAIASAALTVHKKISGKRLEKSDPSAVATLLAKRRFGVNGDRERTIGLDDIIPANRGKAAPTVS